MKDELIILNKINFLFINLIFSMRIVLERYNKKKIQILKGLRTNMYCAKKYLTKSRCKSQKSEIILLIKS